MADGSRKPQRTVSKKTAKSAKLSKRNKTGVRRSTPKLSAKEDKAQRGKNGYFEKGNAYRIRRGERVGATGRPRGKTYGTRLDELGKKKCSSVQWAKDLAVELGLDPKKTTISDALLHADVRHRVKGNAPYHKDQQDRQYGKVADVIQTDQPLIKIIHGVGKDDL